MWCSTFCNTATTMRRPTKILSPGSRAEKEVGTATPLEGRGRRKDVRVREGWAEGHTDAGGGGAHRHVRTREVPQKGPATRAGAHMGGYEVTCTLLRATAWAAARSDRRGPRTGPGTGSVTQAWKDADRRRDRDGNRDPVARRTFRTGGEALHASRDRALHVP